MHPHSYPTPRPRIPAGLLVAALVLVLVPLMLVLAWLAWQWHTLEASYPLIADTLRIAVFLLPLALGGYGVAVGISIVARRWGTHEYIRAHHVTQLTRAQTQVAPLATSFTYHDAHQIAASAPTERLTLAAPLEVVMPLDAWLRWIDDQPHGLLGGRTKAGKTTVATAVLESRLRAQEQVFIIDPHASGWLGLPTAGGVAREGELKRALVAVLSEYLRRMQQREEHKRTTGQELPHDYFGRMTVLIDECNSIADELSTVWATFAKQLASGSRKVGIALLILAQSPLVEDLKISGAMRENFARIALDQRTVQAMIDGERDKERKAALMGAVRTMEYPAAAQMGSEVWLLDRRGLAAGSAPAGADALVWPGWDFSQGCARQVAVESLAADQATFVADVSTVSTDPLEDAGKAASSGFTRPAADTSNPSMLPTPAEIAQIAHLLASFPPSKVAEKLDGYHPRRYAEFKAKVDAVKALMEAQS